MPIQQAKSNEMSTKPLTIGRNYFNYVECIDSAIDKIYHNSVFIDFPFHLVNVDFGCVRIDVHVVHINAQILCSFVKTGMGGARYHHIRLNDTFDFTAIITIRFACHY